MSTPKTHVVYPEARVDRLHLNFPRADPAQEIEPQLAFQVREICPVLEEAWYVPDSGMGTLTVKGRHLERVLRMGTITQDGGRAEAPPHEVGEDMLSFAVACRSCTLVMGMEVEGIPVGCVGPGYSVSLERGRLVPPE